MRQGTGRGRGGSGRGKQGGSGLGESLPVKVAGLWDDFKTLLAMLVDVMTGRYKDLPFKTLIALVAAVLYFLSPIDFLPDFIPFVGYIDDVFVIVLAIDLVRDDLADYRAWREGGQWH